jgi:hypothetical protein
VAFRSYASNLVAGDTNGYWDTFVFDRLNQVTERTSVDSNGVQGNRDSGTPALSRDGRWVAFYSASMNLVPGGTHDEIHVFLRDRTAGTTALVSVDTLGTEGDNMSWKPVVSDDGGIVSFESFASNLVAGDTNGETDVFTRYVRPASPGTGYCSGDGTSTACPCGPGAAGNGCPNSVNQNGASLAGTGTASIAADTLVLEGRGMPNNSALYLQGTTRIAVVFGDGLRCAGGAVIRLGIESNVGGASRYPGTGDPSVSVRGLVTAPGTRTYQVWYRNAANFCTSSTFNLSNGLQLNWGP